jgi:hypothetical protein
MWARGAIEAKEKPKLPPSSTKVGDGSSVISSSSVANIRKKGLASTGDDSEKSRLKNTIRCAVIIHLPFSFLSLFLLHIIISYPPYH